MGAFKTCNFSYSNYVCFWVCFFKKSKLLCIIIFNIINPYNINPYIFLWLYCYKQTINIINRYFNFCCFGNNFVDCMLFDFKTQPFNKILNIIAIIGTIVIICCYLLFTLYPPKMFLFEDPTNGSFGLKK